MYDRAPVASAMAVPAMALPSTVKCTTAPASPVPVRAGLAVVVPPLASFSVTTGALVSRVKESEAVPVLPAALVSLATMVWAPSARPVGVNAQAPLELAVAVVAMAAPP